MKSIKVLGTSITEGQLKFNGDANKMATTKDLIEVSLDMAPQGGFTPNDIKERSRIQLALDKANDDEILLEDADFDNLKKIVNASRWAIRNKDLLNFVCQFE